MDGKRRVVVVVRGSRDPHKGRQRAGRVESRQLGGSVEGGGNSPTRQGVARNVKTEHNGGREGTIRACRGSKVRAGGGRGEGSVGGGPHPTAKEPQRRGTGQQTGLRIDNVKNERERAENRRGGQKGARPNRWLAGGRGHGNRGWEPRAK